MAPAGPLSCGGGLHGLYLVINTGWHELRKRIGDDLRRRTWWGAGIGRGITFLAVVVAWVFFRAGSLDEAAIVLRGMSGINGIVLPSEWQTYFGPVSGWLSEYGVTFGITPAFTRAVHEPLLIASLLAIVWFFPNTQQIMGKFQPAIDIYSIEAGRVRPWLQWTPGWRWAFVSALLMATSIIMLDRVSEFLYFQF